MKYKYPEELQLMKDERKHIAKLCRTIKRIFKYFAWFLVGIITGLAVLLIRRMM
jgi:hypothetical protein